MPPTRKKRQQHADQVHDPDAFVIDRGEPAPQSFGIGEIVFSLGREWSRYVAERI